MLWGGAGARVSRLSMEQSAHKEPIQCLSALGGGLLASSGRDGLIRCWSAGEDGLLSGQTKVQAHAAPVNALAANESCLFSASDDGRVAIWKSRHRH